MALVASSAALILGLYSMVSIGSRSAFEWAWLACNKENDYLHGRWVPFAALVLLFLGRREIGSAIIAPHKAGLVLALAGLTGYLIAVRTLQPRIALGCLPLIILGGIAFTASPRVAKLSMFPVCLIYFAIPVPGLLQITNRLQIFATETAYWLASACGANIYSAGNFIYSVSNSWEFDIAEGCSGVRSLIALTLIAAIYGHLVLLGFGKKLLLIALSVPLAILANAFRITTVVLVAEHISIDVAEKAYHSFSGLLFIPLGIAGIAASAWIIERVSNRPSKSTTNGSKG